MKLRLKFVLVLLSIYTFQNHSVLAMDALPETWRHLAEDGIRELQHLAEHQASAEQYRHNQLVAARGELAALMVHPNPTPEQAGRIAELNTNIAQLERIGRLQNAADNIVVEGFGGLVRAGVGRLNLQNDLARDTNRIRNEGIVNNQGALQRLRHLTQPRTLMGISLAIIAGALGIIGGYYVTKLTYEQIKVRLGVPELVEETSRMSMWQSVIAMFKTKKKIADVKPTDEVILSPEIAAVAERIAEDTRETNALHLPYQNLLLYGPPGTGKTAFAKILAYYSSMDYAILSGSRFAQFESEKAVTELFKILKWAKKNDRGTILFFDEADACFRDRKILDQNGINFVNAFLSETGTNSDKFMFVFASNYESELDSAILSRIHKKIQFPLPALPEREKILNQKITKYIINDKRTYLKNDKEVTETLSIADDVTPEYLYTIAQKIEGFSGRDIDYAVSEMRMRSYRSGNNTLTRNIIEMVITEKVAEVAKDKKISTYQDKKIAQKLASIVNQATAAAA